jgi:hypothetical protein
VQDRVKRHTFCVWPWIMGQPEIELFVEPSREVAYRSQSLGSSTVIHSISNLEISSQACLLRCSPNTRSRSRSWTASAGVDRIQRNFEPMRMQVETWQRSELTDVTAKVIIYEAFVEGKLDAPKHLARTVHNLYFEPKYEEFRTRTIWSLSNARN